MNNFRHSNISLVTPQDNSESKALWRTVQISIGGTDIWRRLALSAATTLKELQMLIFALFAWSGNFQRLFTAPHGMGTQAILDMNKHIRLNETLESLARDGVHEFTFEYNNYWTVKIINLSAYNAKDNETPHCVAGMGIAPDETLEGPLRFRRLLYALESGNMPEKNDAEKILGEDYMQLSFNIDQCNVMLRSLYAGKINK
jgi:hypothetical protein